MDEVAVMSPVGVQKVVVIQDASREVSWSAIRYVMTHTKLLKSGDELILIPVLHQVNNPSTLSFTTARKKCKVLLRVFASVCMYTVFLLLICQSYKFKYSHIYVLRLEPSFFCC